MYEKGAAEQMWAEHLREVNRKIQRRLELKRKAKKAKKAKKARRK